MGWKTDGVMALLPGGALEDEATENGEDIRLGEIAISSVEGGKREEC